MVVKETPWFGEAVISFMLENIKPTDTVFEYGSGGSTVWFAEMAKSVVSVEHDLKWYESVRKVIADNVNLIYVPPDEVFDKEYLSESYGAIGGRSFKEYVSTIDPFEEFDWVVIDGRARNQCIKHSVDKFRKFILLDDSYKTQYREGIGLLSKFKQQIFRGDADGIMSETRIWSR